MLAPGDAIGILGGGQLGRMIALAAAPLGFRVHVLAPEADSPAFDVAARRIVAPYDDEAALAAFAADVAVVTYEFENVPAACAAFLASRVPVLPRPEVLARTQDRLVEKDFIRGLGIPVPMYRAVDDAAGLERALAAIGRPAILKTRRFGYDGKGQAAIRDGTDPAAAWDAIGGRPAILEALVPFTREVSVIAARGADGAVMAYDVCENRHRDGILDVTTVPARLGPGAATEAARITHRIAEALGHVGILTVEMFVTDGERLLVNEIAPRVHNSGHWTIEGAETSQFAQHVRAVAGWPLGATTRRGRAEMRNLVGAAAEGWRGMAAEPGAHLHLYGKREARPGRKMGHVTWVGPEGA